MTAPEPRPAEDALTVEERGKVEPGRGRPARADGPSTAGRDERTRA